MFSAFATMGIPAQTKGQFTRQELQPLAEVNVTSLKEYRLLHLRHGQRQEAEECVHRSGRLLARLRSQSDGAHAALYAAVQEAGEGESAQDRNIRSGILHRFRLCRERCRSNWSVRRRSARCGPRSLPTRTFCRRRHSTRLRSLRSLYRNGHGLRQQNPGASAHEKPRERSAHSSDDFGGADRRCCDNRRRPPAWAQSARLAVRSPSRSAASPAGCSPNRRCFTGRWPA